MYFNITLIYFKHISEQKQCAFILKRWRDLVFDEHVTAIVWCVTYLEK